LKAEESIWSGPRIAGLLILLGLLSAAVLFTSPPALTSQRKNLIFLSHQSLYFFIVGESLAKKLLPDPSIRWSRCHIGLGSIFPLVDGYWVAHGIVQLPKTGRYQILSWLVCFNPDTKEVVFVEVGDDKRGDYDKAVQLVAKVRDQEAASPGNGR
jgi:hypothetical protein